MRRMLITGGSRGIGAKLAEHFAKEFEILLHFNSGKKQADELASKIREQGGIVALIQADLSNKTGPQIISDQITKLGGTLDVLINNAGIFQEDMPVDNINWDIMEKMFTVNVFSAAKLTSLCVPFLQKCDNANVIFLSSVAVRFAYPQHAVYNATKGAVDVLTRSFAKGLGPIRVNAIAPGIVPTGIHQQLFHNNPEEEEKKLFAEYAEKSSSKNIGTTEQIAVTVDYILKNANFTGEIIHINGGLAMS